MRSEVKRLSGKLSYQGKSLQRRTVKQLKEVEYRKVCERKARKEWLKAQVAVMNAEDELTLLITIASISNVAKKAS